jgi:hypothetical protein
MFIYKFKSDYFIKSNKRHPQGKVAVPYFISFLQDFLKIAH